LNRRYVRLVLVFASLIIMSMVTTEHAVASGDSWTTKSSMRVARSRLGVAAVDGKIYAIGGPLKAVSHLILSEWIMRQMDGFQP